MERDEILERLRERIVRFAASRLSRDAAEDLAQEVLLVLHEKYPTLDRVEDLLPLSLEIARFKIWARGERSSGAARTRRFRWTTCRWPAEAAGSVRAGGAARTLDRLEAALEELGERCRELFRLKLEGYTFPEIQKRLKVASI